MASKARQRALAMATIRNGETILEVAFGTGLNLVEILKRNPAGRVEGVDVSKRMLGGQGKESRKRDNRILLSISAIAELFRLKTGPSTSC